MDASEILIELQRAVTRKSGDQEIWARLYTLLRNNRLPKLNKAYGHHLAEDILQDTVLRLLQFFKTSRTGYCLEEPDGQWVNRGKIKEIQVKAAWKFIDTQIRFSIHDMKESRGGNDMWSKVMPCNDPATDKTEPLNVIDKKIEDQFCYSTREVSEHLGVPQRTLRRWAEKHEKTKNGLDHRRDGKCLRLSLEATRAYMKSKE